MKRVLVYCSASNDLSPVFYSEMRLLGETLAKSGHSLVFGGGRDGLMGAVADGHFKVGGKTIGVVPQYFNQPHIVYENLSELIVTRDLMERKKKMLELSDVIVASPGGVGTYDEITEAVALKQLGEINKPIFLHNFMDYWQSYMDHMMEMKQQNMIRQKLEDLYTVCSDYSAVVQELA